MFINQLWLIVFMSKKEVIASAEHKIGRILPEKYKFMTNYDSLKSHLENNLSNFSKEEWQWFSKSFQSRRKNKREILFLEAIPGLIQDKTCSCFLHCLVQNPSIKIAEIAKKMGKFTRSIQFAREKLERLELIVVHYEAWKETTMCYLNDGEIKKNGYPPIPTILKLILKMMEEKHGKDNLLKWTSKNEDVQRKADLKYKKQKKKN